MKTKDYIDLARPLTKTGTDYAVAKLLRLTTTTVQCYSSGQTIMNNRTALRLSILLKREFSELVAAAELERQRDRRDRKALVRLLNQSEHRIRAGDKADCTKHQQRSYS